MYMIFRIPRILTPFAMILAVLFVAGPRAGATPEPVSVATLPNGLRIILAQSHAVALVSVDIWVRAGISRQSPDHPGVAHYLEHMLFKGTSTRPDESAIDGAIEDLGGTVDASTSYDWAHFYTVVPAQNFTGAIGVLSDAIEHAKLTQANVDSERQIIADEVARSSDDPGEVMGMAVRRLAYGPDHPYGETVTGLPSDIANVTLAQIQGFYDKFYVPNDTTVVVAGDVTPEQVLAAANADFGKWAFDKDLPEPGNIPAIEPTMIKRAVVRGGGSESYITMAFFAPSVAQKPDVWITDVLLTLLGQGGNNRLQTDLLTRRHLVDSISADYLTQRGQGLFTITASFPTGNPDLVEKAVVDEVNRLRDELAPVAEVDAAKRSLLSSYLFDTQTVSGRADALGFYDMIDSNQYDVDYIKNFGQVTPADIQMVARKYLDTNAYSIVTMVPQMDQSNARATVYLASAKGSVLP